MALACGVKDFTVFSHFDKSIKNYSGMHRKINPKDNKLIMRQLIFKLFKI